MEIEIENDDSGDDISDGDADSLYCTGAFLAWEAWRKMGSVYEVLSLGSWRLWGRGRLICVPHLQEKCKIVSYIKKYIQSHIRIPFFLKRKVTCLNTFCTETGMLLQTVFITVSE